MSWEYEFDKRAFKELKRLDKAVQQSIITYIEERILKAETPRVLGKGLKGDLSNLWRYRIGNYRIICSLEDAKMIVLVVAVGHRKDIYE